MNGNCKEILRQGLIQTCSKDDDDIIEKLCRFMDMVIEKNRHMNLTAITEPEDFAVKHYIDSLSICRNRVFAESKKIIDVGTGAGFPGIPLATAYPDKEFVLMDSLKKRLKFIDEAVSELGLENVRTVHARAEELGHSPEHREAYDLCVSRAVASLAVLSEYCLPLVKPEGYFVPYKTGSEDLTLGDNAVRLLGGKREKVEAFPQFTGILEFISLDHRLVYIKKVKASPERYPRKAGTPSKEPL